MLDLNRVQKALCLVVLVPIWPPAVMELDKTCLLLCGCFVDVTANNEGWFMTAAIFERVMQALNCNVYTMV